MKYALIALALFLGTAYFVQAAPFSWDYISGSNIVRLIAPQNTATVQVPALTSTATATLATSTGAVIVSPNETTWAKLGVGTSSPTEILHLSRPSWGYTTTRFDSGTTQGQFYAYGGDNTVAFGSRSVSPVNLIYGDSVRATLYGPNASSTILDLKSPSATGESTFTTTLPLGGSNREFIDWTLENYGTDHFGSINIAKQGTGTIRPFGIRFWNSDLGPIHENGVFQFLTYPTGHTAIGNYSSTTGNAVPAILRVGSSTTGSLFRVDNGSTTQYFLVSSAGASTTALTISGLSDGCLNVTSGLVGSTGSACGSGGGGGLTTWLPGTGYLYTATSTDGALAAYFSATSTTATSTIAGAVNIGSATTAARFGLRNILSQDTLLIEDQASDATPFRIDQSGQVTTGGTITVGGNVNAYHGGTPGTGLFSFFQSDGSTGAFWGAINSTFQRLGIDGSPIVLNGRNGSTGNVGIGTSTTPTFKLQVNGANTQNIFRAASSTGSAILDVLGTGIVQITGTTTTSNLSIGSLTGVLKATAGTVATGLVDLASEVTGRLGITNGGTGTSTAPTTDQILVGNSGGSYDYRRITAGTNVTVSTSTPGEIQISATGGSSSGVATTSTWTVGNLARVFSNGAIDSVATSSLNIDLGNTVGTLGATRGGTGLTSYSTGDLIYASGANTLANRTIGSTGNVLSVVGGVPSWVSTSSLNIAGGGGFADPLTTNGDIIARIAGATTRLPQGANGTYLGVSGGVLGYYTPSGSGTINSGTTGQLPRYDSAGTTLTATSTLFIADSGKVGVGVTTPLSGFDVARYGTMGGFDYQLLMNPPSGIGSRFAFTSASNTKAVMLGESSAGMGDLSIKTASDANWGAGTATWNDRMMVLNTGEIGIGTNFPSSTLAVNSSGSNAVVNIYSTSSATDYGLIQVSNAGTILNPSNRSLILQPNGGAVAVGTSTLTSRFGVQASIVGQTISEFFNSVGSSTFAVLTATSSVTHTSTLVGFAQEVLARVTIGINTITGYYGSGKLFGALNISGLFYQADWKQVDCSALVGATQIVADGLTGCDGFSFYEDGTETLAATTQGGLVYSRLSTSLTAGGAGVFVNAPSTGAFIFGTSTPKLEVTARLHTIQNWATSTRAYIGFTNIATAGTAYEIEPTVGCYFTASSTNANWLAVCRTSAAAQTVVDTGVASTTAAGTGNGVPYRFFLEADSLEARFYIQSSEAGNLTQVAGITTNVPTTVALNAGAHFGSPTGIVARGIDIYDMNFGWRKALR